MITRNKNQFLIQKQVTLSKAQEHKLSILPEEKQKDYLLSIAGLFRKKISFFKPQDLKVDRMAEKDSGSVLRSFKGLLDNGSNTFHKPIIRTELTKWIGVEIECLIPSDNGDESDSCECCGGSGENSCYNCEGSGHVNLTDDNGNDYRVDCGSCDGNGTQECGECDGSSSSSGSSGIFEKVRHELKKAKVTRASVKSDGSLSAEGHVGVEVTILLNAAHGFEPIERACKVLNALGAIVNSTCGLHVHLDSGSLTRNEALLKGMIFEKFLPIMGKLVPKSRSRNQYCKLRVSALDGDRYSAVNMTAYSKHKTIEIRLHSGTTNPDKIKNWALLLLEIFSLEEAPLNKVGSIRSMQKNLELNQSLLGFFRDRFRQFNSESNSVNSDDETSGVNDLDEAI